MASLFLRTTTDDGSAAVTEFAEEDFDDPHGTTTVMRARLEVDDLSAGTGDPLGPGDEDVEMEYGLDGAAATTVSNFVNFISTDKEAQFGRLNQNTGSAETGDPEGVAALTARWRLTSNRGSTDTNNAKIKELEITAINQVNDLLRVIVPIDLDETKAGEQRDQEQVHDEVLTLIRAGILQKFEYGTQTPLFVKVRMATAGDLESREVNAIFDRQELHGKMVVICDQVTLDV